MRKRKNSRCCSSFFLWGRFEYVKNINYFLICLIKGDIVEKGCDKKLVTLVTTDTFWPLFCSFFCRFSGNHKKILTGSGFYGFCKLIPENITFFEISNLWPLVVTRYSTPVVDLKEIKYKMWPFLSKGWSQLNIH